MKKAILCILNTKNVVKFNDFLYGSNERSKFCNFCEWETGVISHICKIYIDPKKSKLVIIEGKPIVGKSKKIFISYKNFVRDLAKFFT